MSILDPKPLMPAEAAARYTPTGLAGAETISTARAQYLLQWEAAVANRDNAQAKVLVLGDSITEGSTITALSAVYGHRLAAALRKAVPLADGTTRGSTGVHLPLQNTNVLFSPVVAPTGTGTVPVQNTSWGLAARAVTLSPTTQTLTVTLPTPATSMDIEWVPLNGTGDTISVSIDGGAATTYSGKPANATVATRLTFNARDLHTVVVSCTSGSVAFNYVRHYDGDESRGIHVLVAGRAGARTSDFTSPDTTVRANLKQSITNIGPDLCIIELGTNDFFQQIDPNVCKNNLLQIIGDIHAATPNACFVLLTPATPQLGGAITYQWSQYLNAIKSIPGMRTDTIHIDMGLRIYPASSDPQGIYSDTAVHPNNKGTAVYAQHLSAALTGGMMQGPAAYAATDTWASPTLDNGWTNLGSGYARAGYRKDSTGQVQLKGLIVAGTKTPGTVLFTLPAGFRPSALMVFPSANAGAYGEVLVRNDGGVTINYGSGGWLTLNGINFLAEG